MRKARWAVAIVAAGAVIVLAASLWTTVRFRAPLPVLSMAMNWVTSQQQPATASIEWPDVRESAATVSGFSQTWETGRQQEVPIASVTKMMTAYLILRDHPLSSGSSGPTITITVADVAAYKAAIANDDSGVKIAAGEELTERQALEALMLPSADDIAWALADWDDGSLTAFAAKMNAQARAMGMDNTDYTDPSGVASSTVSTAHDQLILVRAAMEVPAFAQFVSLRSATIPVAGTITNFNSETGEDGIIGVKTGSTNEALGCWAFAVRREVAGTERTVYGVVLGAPGNLSTMVPAAINAGVNLAGNVAGKAVQQVTVLPAGSVVGHISVPWSNASVAIVTTRALTGLAPSGSHVTVRTTSADPGSTFTTGQQVGSITATGLISGSTTTPVVVQGSSGKPTGLWRLVH
jgi:D-alanyl-D-alanine carboxypeptidase (penicillin-binding protein 5/6)